MLHFAMWFVLGSAIFFGMIDVVAGHAEKESGDG